MDKRAFKQRMQNLKSYRENNPGKGYIEFMEDLAKFKAKEWGENEDIILTEMLNDNTYNYKQMYEDNPNYNIQEGHFQDTYKTVYHPTFSKESMYSGKKSQYNPEGITGGWWDYNNKIFHAGYKQDIRNTQKYLNQEDPGWKVKAFQDGGEASDPKKEKFFQATGRNSYGANSKLLDQQVQRQIDALATEKARREAIINQSTKLTSQANNEGYRIIERLMDDPSYLERAREVKRNFGDNYTRIYSDLIQDYNTNPNNIPKAILDSGISGRAKMRAKGNAQTRVDKGGTPPGRGEFEYAIDPLSTDLTGDVTLHELNHYTDFIKNKSPHADANSNLFYQMSKDIDGVKVDEHDSYFSLPTEQKAYMNQLREYLFNSEKINRRNDKVSPSTIKQALTDIQNKSEYDSTIRASKQFKSLRGYTKWFNTIPLLGTTALGTNAYFNDNKNE